MKFPTRSLSVAALAGLFALGACDVDNDGELDSAEFEQSAEAVGEDLADAANRAGEAVEAFGEDVEAFFAEWDENADRAFDRAEFERWWNDANPFDGWDADGNDQLNAAEIDGVLYVDLDTLDRDADGYVTRTEMREGLFEALDDDDDGRIDREEWSDARV